MVWLALDYAALFDCLMVSVTGSDFRKDSQSKIKTQAEFMFGWSHKILNNLTIFDVLGASNL